MIVYRICTYDLYAYFVRMIVHMFRTYDIRTFHCTDDLFILSVHLILHMICTYDINQHTILCTFDCTHRLFVHTNCTYD